ncbi:MAG: lycopene cyclase domain-containing protein [Austwickia sp.]|nr:lycopene cyclase domain-containing protein [Austwickia sp.]
MARWARSCSGPPAGAGPCGPVGAGRGPGVPEYTVLAVLSVLAVVALERFRWRTGIFRSARYWLSMGIVAFFQVLVDGWLTKLSAPIVIYAPEHHLGVRFPWDVPIEDFLFGFSMVTLAILWWVRAAGDAPTAGTPDAVTTHPQDRCTEAR